MTWTAPNLAGITKLPSLRETLANTLPNLVREGRFFDRVSPLLYGTTVRPSGRTSTGQILTVTDDVAFTIANPDQPREGVEMTLEIRNASGLTMGAVTFGSHYALEGAFQPPPIDGSAVYVFLCTSATTWKEISRSIMGEAPPGAPTAAFTMAITGRTVDVTDTSTTPAGSITAWNWDWGDGTADGVVQNPANHTYGADGTYTITLTVTNTAGLQGVTSRQANVAAGTVTLGRPFGVLAGGHWATNTTLAPYMDPFTLSYQGVEPGNGSTTGIVARIIAARDLGIKLVLVMTGGSHSQYMTDFGDGDGPKFDRNKWNARQQLFNTPAIKTAVANGVADKTIVGADVMDEPFVSGGADGGGNTWGPPGTMTKKGSTPYEIFANSNSIDDMCSYVKAIFPTLPCGVGHPHQLFEPTRDYDVADFLISQYNVVWGDYITWANQGRAIAVRGGHKLVFSLNLINGGSRISGCPEPQTGGPGTRPPNCKMSPTQVETFAAEFATGSVGLLMWEYNATVFSDPDFVAAFNNVAADYAALSLESWAR